MSALRFLVVFTVMLAVHTDIDGRLALSAAQGNMDGARLVQLTIEQDEALLDRYTPPACAAEWWALNRAAISMIGKALTYSIAGDSSSASIALDAARTARWFGREEIVTCR